MTINKKLYFLVLACVLSIVFWDVIPVYGIHYYQCKSNGGFTVYKTLGEWKKENPGVVDTLVPVNGRPVIKGNITRYQLNQRFTWDTTKSPVWYILYKKDEKIIDVKTNEVIAENIDFYTNLVNPFVTPTTNLRDLKMWMKIDHCKGDSRNNQWLVGSDSFISLKSKFKRIHGEIL